MRVFDVQTKEFRKFDKKYGWKCMDEESMLNALREFLNNGTKTIDETEIERRRSIWKSFSLSLHNIDKAMREDPWELYASSVLFMLSRFFV